MTTTVDQIKNINIIILYPPIKLAPHHPNYQLKNKSAQLNQTTPSTHASAPR